MSSNEVPSPAILVPNEPVSVAHLTDVERVRMHCFSDLASTPEELRKVILQLGQRQLQDRFRKVYQRATWSNNNTWLRRYDHANIVSPCQIVVVPVASDVAVHRIGLLLIRGLLARRRLLEGQKSPSSGLPPSMHCISAVHTFLQYRFASIG